MMAFGPRWSGVLGWSRVFFPSFPSNFESQFCPPPPVGHRDPTQAVSWCLGDPPAVSSPSTAGQPYMTPRLPWVSHPNNVRNLNNCQPTRAPLTDTAWVCRTRPGLVRRLRSGKEATAWPCSTQKPGPAVHYPLPPRPSVALPALEAVRRWTLRRLPPAGRQWRTTQAMVSWQTGTRSLVAS